MCSNIKMWIVALLCCAFSTNSNKYYDALDERKSQLLINQFIDNIHNYCNEQYNTDSYTDLIVDIFASAQTDVTSDVEGSKGNRMIVRTYLDKLKNTGMVVTYNRDYTLSACQYDNTTLWGCLLSKQVTYKGKSPIQITEFVEIVQDGTAYKIGSIHSNVLQPLVVRCEKGTKAIADNECKLVAQAERDLQDNNAPLAAAHYEQAKACSNTSSPVLERALKKVNSDSLYAEGIKKGIQLMEQGQLEEALHYLETIRKSYTNISPDMVKRLENNISSVKDKIQYRNTTASGDYYYQQGFYDKALNAYNDALRFGYSAEVNTRKNYCEEQVKAAYYKKVEAEIAIAEYNALQSRQLDESFAIFMKHRHSGRLSGLHFFIMAQIIIIPSKNIKQQFNLKSKSSQCRLRRQFMLNALNLGYQSEGFDIILNDYFTNKDRTCE